MKEAQKFGELDASYVERSVTQITQSSGYMSSVIDQFGSFLPQEEVVEFDVGEVVAETLDAFSGSFEHEGITIERNLEGIILLLNKKVNFQQNMFNHAN